MTPVEEHRSPLRILAVSNLYPPYYVGGYELGCRDVTEALKARGHQVKVLTSTYRVDAAMDDGEVYRWMQADFGRPKPSGLGPTVKALLKKERSNYAAFRRVCRTFRPDVIYVWNPVEASISFLFWAQRVGLPVCYYVFDEWVSHWEKDDWYQLWESASEKMISAILKRLLRPMFNLPLLPPASGSLDLSHSQFATHFLKRSALEAGRLVADAPVVHWGLDLSRYCAKEAVTPPQRLLYAGQLIWSKGVHTAIQAFAYLKTGAVKENLTLTIVGGGTDLEYQRQLRDLVSFFGLEDSIQFLGLVPREELVRIYPQHDILIFSTIGDEAFGITILEAMASGLAVVATGTGGSCEILEGEANCLLYPPADAQACATQIQRLMKDESLYQRVCRQGRETVEQRFHFTRTVDRIETLLRQAAVR